MSEFRKLFSNAKVGSMETKNRLFMGEIGGSGNEEGHYTEECIEFYAERAKGGPGLIMCGGGCPDISGKVSKNIPMLDDDKYIPRLKEMSRRIREPAPEMKLGIQLFHVGRQMHVDSKGAVPGVEPVAPSPIEYKFGTTPHKLTTEEVEYQVNQFVEAARRVKEGGFDCVGLHGAHGYLISQFISPYTNKRNDKYGGSIENRARFACDIIEGIKEKCGEDFPVLIKINSEDYVDSEPQINLEHTLSVAPLLEEAGVDEIHVSSGTHESVIPCATAPYMTPQGTYLDDAAEVREVVDIPVGGIHRIKDPKLAEEALEEGKVDLVWMTRALIADPELPNKTREGRLDEIRTCIGCGTCIDRAWQDWLGDCLCAINPEAWREREFRIQPTLRPKEVLVIGGGPAGLEAARVAAKIGHEVTLWEKDDKLGGQVNLASVAPDKDEFENLIRYFSVQMEKLGVDVELEKEATRESVEKMDPEVAIIATGASPKNPSIEGVDKDIVEDAWDVLAGKAKVGEEVVVIGGGEVGMETAQYLVNQGKDVTMVVRSEMGKGMVRMVFYYIRGWLAHHDVEMLTHTKTEEITEKGVVVEDDGERKIEADSVVIATGTKPNISLHEELWDIVPEVYMAGDCLYPGDIKSAIYQGATVARMLEIELPGRTY